MFCVYYLFRGKILSGLEDGEVVFCMFFNVHPIQSTSFNCCSMSLGS